MAQFLPVAGSPPGTGSRSSAHFLVMTGPSASAEFPPAVVLPWLVASPLVAMLPLLTAELPLLVAGLSLQASAPPLVIVSPLAVGWPSAVVWILAVGPPLAAALPLALGRPWWRGCSSWQQCRPSGWQCCPSWQSGFPSRWWDLQRQ